MENLSLEQMTQEHLDVLKELGNIGAGNATTALAQMLGCKLDMSVPQVKILEFYEVGSLIGGEEQLLVGVYLAIEGDINGSIMFLMGVETAKHLVSKLMPVEMMEEGMSFSEMELSALQEVGNIITGAYLNSLASLTNMMIIPSTPALAIDMAAAILSIPAIEFGTMRDNILLINTRFFDEIALDGYFILVPDVESYAKMLSSLGIPV